VKAGGFFFTLPTCATLSTLLVIINKQLKAHMVDKMIYISTSTRSLYALTDREKNKHLYIYPKGGKGGLG
jgi:hypothetical protein